MAREQITKEPPEPLVARKGETGYSDRRRLEVVGKDSEIIDRHPG